MQGYLDLFDHWTYEVKCIMCEGYNSTIGASSFHSWHSHMDFPIMHCIMVCKSLCCVILLYGYWWGNYTIAISNYWIIKLQYMHANLISWIILKIDFCVWIGWLCVEDEIILITDSCSHCQGLMFV